MRFISTWRGQTPAPVVFRGGRDRPRRPMAACSCRKRSPRLRLDELVRWEKLDYSTLCFEFLRKFATDIPVDDFLRASWREATSASRRPTPPRCANSTTNLFVLELFHGPTLAFKDFALQLLGNLYERQCATRGETINVLGATSGDTGAAAIYGLLGKPGTAIFILYPDGRVSPLQERQMACTGAANVFALAVDGTFDDAQSALKEVFGDQAFRIAHRLSAVNSINLARVLAQCVYYLYARLRLPASNRAEIEFVVPTGNFGNVLAGWLLERMGVPIRGFKVATNQNDILYRLFTTGEYRVAEVAPSLAPSMDIQVASNFERFLYYNVGRDPERVRAIMAEFKATGRFVFPHFDRDLFTASHCTDAEIVSIIQQVHSRYGYIADPHTACGFKAIDPARTSVVLATAHPAKFPDTIKSALGLECTDSEPGGVEGATGGKTPAISATPRRHPGISYFPASRCFHHSE